MAPIWRLHLQITINYIHMINKMNKSINTFLECTELKKQIYLKGERKKLILSYIVCGFYVDITYRTVLAENKRDLNFVLHVVGTFYE